MQPINMIIHITSSHIVIFHQSLKKQSYHFRKLKPDDKGRNRLTLPNCTRERQISSESFEREFFRLIPTESLTAFTLLGHFAVNFLSELGFSVFLLRLFTDPVA